jgi:hypothetical protein
MTTFKLYGIWERLLTQWLSDTCATRRTNLTWLTPAYTASAGCGAVFEWEGAGQCDRAEMADQGQGRQSDAALEPLFG